MNPIIIIQTDFIQEQEFTFDNFDELKGYLKGKTIYVREESLQEVKDILGLLGFRHEKQLVKYDYDTSRIIEVDNTTYTVDFSKNYEDYDINGEEFIEDYYKLKEELIYSIIPWPITISEAREMNNLKLSKIQALAETMVAVVHNLELTEDDMEVEWMFGRHGIKDAAQFLEDLDIQHDNLKYIW